MDTSNPLISVWVGNPDLVEFSIDIPTIVIGRRRRNPKKRRRERTPIIELDRYLEYLQTIHASLTEALTTSREDLIQDVDCLLDHVRPDLTQESKRRCIYTNLAESALLINRSPSHLTRFLGDELETRVALKIDGSALIEGNCCCGEVDIVIRNYIKTYVECNNCGNVWTSLGRGDRGQITMICPHCNSRRAVPKLVHIAVMG